ncbi:MAG: hypothetical protein K8R67_01505 [Desulfobacteraceae bacterium]|nr:hypothetical protein [Desulfobacteraceae bacterium]
MKTIYVFTIILILSMVSPNAFAGSGGGGDGGDDTIGAISAAPTVSFYTPPNAVQCSHNVRTGPLRGTAKASRVNKHFHNAINFMNQHSSNKTNRDEDIAFIASQIKLRILLSDGSVESLERLGALGIILILLVIQDKD